MAYGEEVAAAQEQLLEAGATEDLDDMELLI